MKNNKSKKILATAIILGIPVATTMISNKANAMIGKKPPVPPKPTITTPMVKQPSTPKVKPPVPPKPSSSVVNSKIGSGSKVGTISVKSLVTKFNELGTIGKGSGKMTTKQPFTPKNENKVVTTTLDSLFSSGKPTKPSTPTPTPGKLDSSSKTLTNNASTPAPKPNTNVGKLDLTSKTPSSNASTPAPKPNTNVGKLDLTSKTPSSNASTPAPKPDTNVGKLDLTSKTPSSNASTPAPKPTPTPGKLDPNAGSHLNGIFENKGTSPTTKPTGSSTTSGKLLTTANTETQSSTTSTPTPGKLDPNAGNHLNKLFENKGTSSSSINSTGKAFENPDTNIPKAPPLTTNTQGTLTPTTTPSTGTPNIPDAPPLPPGGIIPPVKGSTTPTTNTQTTTNANKDSNTTLSQNKLAPQQPAGFMDELKLKLSKK